MSFYFLSGVDLILNLWKSNDVKISIINFTFKLFIPLDRIVDFHESVNIWKTHICFIFNRTNLQLKKTQLCAIYFGQQRTTNHSPFKTILYRGVGEKLILIFIQKLNRVTCVINNIPRNEYKHKNLFNIYRSVIRK